MRVSSIMSTLWKSLKSVHFMKTVPRVWLWAPITQLTISYRLAFSAYLERRPSPCQPSHLKQYLPKLVLASKMLNSKRINYSVLKQQANDLRPDACLTRLQPQRFHWRDENHKHKRNRCYLATCLSKMGCRNSPPL